MGQILDYTKSYKVQQHENTLKYVAMLEDQGMQQISESELLNMLNDLDYSIDKSMCFNYYNDLNKNHYMARSMHYKDNKTKQSYAHFEQRYSNFQNLEKLQKIRGDYFVFDGKRVWDL